MATNTTNLELKKPAYSDTADISDINGNMDIIDTAVNAVENGMAIIANGNTHAAITSGQYVYIRKHGSLSEGLYKATQTIATNGTLSSSNVTAVSGGALNALNEQIVTSNSKMTKYWRIDNVQTDANGYIDITGLTNSLGNQLYSYHVIGINVRTAEHTTISSYLYSYENWQYCAVKNGEMQSGTAYANKQVTVVIAYAK